jgi:hypothetical protein
MTDIEAVQWFFDLDKLTTGFNWPVNAQGMADAKRELDAAVTRKESAGKVLAVYKKLAGALGPTVMSMLLQSDDAFPEVNHSEKLIPPSPGKVTLYVDAAGRRVLAEFFNEWGKAPVFTEE